jgi:ubiquinone/menaquinone biosynthesis C-methylase UbiE
MHKFDPKNLDRLISSERYQKTNSHQLLTEFGLKPGRVAADVGCGPGFFTFPMAEIVGPKGRVHAWDISQEMLDYLRKRNPPENIIIAPSKENRLPAKDRSIDFILLANLLHETETPIPFLHEIKRILKPQGKVVNWDWMKIEEEEGPPMAERISMEEAVYLFQRAGYTIVRTEDKRNSHYVIIAEQEQDGEL